MNTTPGLVCSHHHLYSSLARGMPPPPHTPIDFADILEMIWWRLDQALDLDILYWSAKLGALEAIRQGTTAIIDHHESPEKFSTLFLSKPNIGSTCEIIYNIMKTINNKLIDKEIATYIYSGIITDTGSFRYPLTTAKTHNITSELFN